MDVRGGVTFVTMPTGQSSRASARRRGRQRFGLLSLVAIAVFVASERGWRKFD